MFLKILGLLNDSITLSKNILGKTHMPMVLYNLVWSLRLLFTLPWHFKRTFPLQLLHSATKCFTDLEKLNLLRWFGLRLEPIFDNALSASWNDAYFKSGQKDSKIIVTNTVSLHWCLGIRIRLPRPPPFHDSLNEQILSLQYGYRDGLSICTTYRPSRVTEDPLCKDTETPVCQCLAKIFDGFS